MSKAAVKGEQAKPMSSLVPMSGNEVANTLLGGAVIGLVVVGAYLLLNHFVFGSVLCRPQSSADCSQAPNYSIIVAQIIGVIVGLGLLVRLRIYRPLLVVLATLVAMWTLLSLIAPLPWYSALIAGAVLFGLSYGLFAWVARIRLFLVSIIVAVVLVVIVRLAFA